MNGRWAYNWVQILAHHYVLSAVVFAAAWLLALAGVFKSPALFEQMNFMWVWLALVLMGGVSVKVMDSVKTGVLVFGLSLAVLGAVLGLLGWFGLALTETSVLGMVVVLALMMSNLVHVMAALLREMARGGFQHDALAEALNMNAAPVFLSNLTTGLGFAVAAFYDSRLLDAAWVVLLGALVSYTMLMTGLPLILLRWFLEFRVGHYEDRHGFIGLAEKFQAYPKWVTLMLWLSALVVVMSAVYLWRKLDNLNAVGVMLATSFVVLLVFWHDLKITLMTLLSSVLSVILVLTAYFSVQNFQSISAVILIVPLGIVLDDAIHYFARYLKSKRGYFNDVESCHRFALASVGRPIWATTQILIAGLLVLSFSENSLVQQASLITLLAVLLASYIVLVWLPALGLKKTKNNR